MYTIHRFVAEGATCQMSGKVNVEAVVVSSDAYGLKNAILSVPELVKLMRLHQVQAEKNGQKEGVR